MNVLTKVYHHIILKYNVILINGKICTGANYGVDPYLKT